MAGAVRIAAARARHLTARPRSVSTCCQRNPAYQPCVPICVGADEPAPPHVANLPTQRHQARPLTADNACSSWPLRRPARRCTDLRLSAAPTTVAGEAANGALGEQRRTWASRPGHKCLQPGVDQVSNARAGNACTALCPTNRSRPHKHLIPPTLPALHPLHP